MRSILITLLLALCLKGMSQDTTYIKVHFLYGSRPVSKYKKVEKKWFGGVYGGHVGIEGDSGKIVDFSPKGKFHVFANPNNRHSKYAEHDVRSFYAILGGDPDSVKMTIVYIPITNVQKQKFDSIAKTYLQNTPYDYAFIGMRCGAAAYDILGQLEILPKYEYSKMYKKIFYPKKLRKRLLDKAAANKWLVFMRAGTKRRIWEKD